MIYDILFKAASETLLTIAADPKHLGARIGVTSVLHTWGSALTHHPHVHMIVPGGGLSPGRPDAGSPAGPASSCRCACCRGCSAGCFSKGSPPPTPPGAGIFGAQRHLLTPPPSPQYLAPLRHAEWVVYSKRPFAGPEAVLAYLSRYTHRVAISNSRLVACDAAASRSNGRIIATKGRAGRRS